MKIGLSVIVACD